MSRVAWELVKSPSLSLGWNWYLFDYLPTGPQGLLVPAHSASCTVIHDHELLSPRSFGNICEEVEAVLKREHARALMG